ncbi:MAG TPA: hypothetical protein VGF96_06310 [Terracidiphilus sp.]|jgi:hypothetical protein
MEIGPIPATTQDFMAVKAPAADFQLSAVVTMEAVARPDHSARPSTRKKAAGAEEMEADNPAPSGEVQDSAEELLQPHISFFA